MAAEQIRRGWAWIDLPRAHFLIGRRAACGVRVRNIRPLDADASVDVAYCRRCDAIRNRMEGR